MSSSRMRPKTRRRWRDRFEPRSSLSGYRSGWTRQKCASVRACDARSMKGSGRAGSAWSSSPRRSSRRGGRITSWTVSCPAPSLAGTAFCRFGTGSTATRSAPTARLLRTSSRSVPLRPPLRTSPTRLPRLSGTTPTCAVSRSPRSRWSAPKQRSALGSPTTSRRCWASALVESFRVPIGPAVPRTCRSRSR